MYIFTASQADCDHCVANVTTDLLSTWYLPQTKGDWEGKCDCPRCLSVSKITQKRVHGFGWNVACRQISGHGRTDQLLSPIRIIVQMPEPDCFLRYRMRCNTEFYLLGKITCRYWAPVTAVRCGFKWFYSPRAVGTPLSEVNALYRWEHLCRRYMHSTDGNTFVGGTCTLQSAFLVSDDSLCLYTVFKKWTKIKKIQLIFMLL